MKIEEFQLLIFFTQTWLSHDVFSFRMLHKQPVFRITVEKKDGFDFWSLIVDHKSVWNVSTYCFTFYSSDNCPSDSNADQADGDTDGVGDACGKL